MYLRKSTASQEILLGPFVDSSDGDTAETGLTIANTDIKIFKHGATTLADKNSGGATHISGGLYHATLDATDTDTVGMLVVYVKVAGALYVRIPFDVIEEAVYDRLFAASAAGYQIPIWAAANSIVNLSATTIAALTSTVTAAAIADQVWDEARSGHTTAGSFGESLQPATGQILSMTSNTLTLSAPWTDGSIVGRECVVGRHGMVLVSHAGSGVYTFLPAITGAVPANGSDFWLGGLGSGTLLPEGLDAISITAPTGVASTFREMVVAVWRWIFKKHMIDRGASQIKHYADNGTTVIATQTFTSAGGVDTINNAT